MAGLVSHARSSYPKREKGSDKAALAFHAPVFGRTAFLTMILCFTVCILHHRACICSTRMANRAGYVTGHPLCNRTAGCVTGHPVD